MIWSTIQWAYLILNSLAVLVLLVRHCTGSGGGGDIIMFLPGAYSINTLYKEIDGFIRAP
jgi:hypothetical protein